MFGLNTGELIVILIIALIVFGPQKLPQIGGAIGKSIKEFKKALSAPDDEEKKGGANAAEPPKPENPPETENNDKKQE